jgi:RNA polymerase sigma factor (sigma-70 family)
MATRQAGVLRHIQQLYSLGTFSQTTDARLLAQFLARRDAGAEYAFEVLVQRHGPMVLDVCRGVLRDEHSAEDAFQATFLVLARKAASLWVKDSLGGWLHGVAHRVAAKAKSDANRRRRHERHAAERSRTATIEEPVHADHRSEARIVLNEEIARLPEKYRAPTILCYLEAMSYEAAAGRLGLTVATVRGRLARARARLRSRLTRRGIEVSGLAIGYRHTIRALPLVRPELVHSTVRSVSSWAFTKVVDVHRISATVISLSEEVSKAMTRTKMSVAALTLALGTITAGALVSAQPPGRGESKDPNQSKPVAEQPTASAGLGGNLVVDWNPVRPNAQKVEITVDAARHCVHLSPVSVKRGSRPNDGAVRLDLERGKTYEVTAAGEAFMGPATGADADPFPGVMLVFGTDEEDGYAIRQVSLAAGKSITFKTPWAISPDDEVYLMAFFLDIGGMPNRGSYKLTVTEAGSRDAKHLQYDQRLDGNRDIEFANDKKPR